MQHNLPSLVILDLGDYLPLVRDALGDLTDGVPPVFIDEELDNYIETIFQCVQNDESAYPCLLDYKISLVNTDQQYDDKGLRVSSAVGKMANYIYNSLREMGAYIDHELPYHYTCRNADDTIFIAPNDARIARILSSPRSTAPGHY